MVHRSQTYILSQVALPISASVVVLVEFNWSESAYGDGDVVSRQDAVVISEKSVGILLYGIAKGRSLVVGHGLLKKGCRNSDRNNHLLHALSLS
jgi:hypothetical protein